MPDGICSTQASGEANSTACISIQVPLHIVLCRDIYTHICLNPLGTDALARCALRARSDSLKAWVGVSRFL